MRNGQPNNQRINSTAGGLDTLLQLIPFHHQRSQPSMQRGMNVVHLLVSIEQLLYLVADTIEFGVLAWNHAEIVCVQH